MKASGMYTILIIDDDVQILDMVELVLWREGFQVLRAHTAQDALQIIETAIPDLIIIDGVLPDIDGVRLCRRLRSHMNSAEVPIVFLTGQVLSHGVVEALSAGADDYIRKPFAPRELIARVRALIRRSVFYSDANMPVIRLLPDECSLLINDRKVGLTRVEFDLMRFLCETPHELHTTDDLLTQVWRYPSGVGDAALVRNHIHNLRRKIEVDPERPLILQSRHGRGYVVKAIIEDAADVASVG